jgi:hypothetical protein
MVFDGPGRRKAAFIYLSEGTNPGSRTLLSQARQMLAHSRGYIIRRLMPGIDRFHR